MPLSDPFVARAKRLLFRARHRGTRELDLLVGGFAAAQIMALDSAGLDEFERILDLPDVELYDWSCGRVSVPPEHDGPVLRALLSWRPLSDESER